MSTPPKITGTPPSKLDESWRQHLQAEIQRQPERLEETAKFLSGIITISLTIFITNPARALAEWTSSWFTAAAILWMFSAMLSIFVLFPWRYKLNEDSAVDIKRAYAKITKRKRQILVLSLVAFLVALSLAAYAFLAGAVPAGALGDAVQ